MWRRPPHTTPEAIAQYINNCRKIEAWLQFLTTRWPPLDDYGAAGVEREMYVNDPTSL